MKILGMRDCAGWYLEFMDEMREFATQPADVETLEAIKSRFENALLQVGELIEYEKNKQASCWSADNMMRLECMHASFKPLKPKKYKKVKSKLKKARFKPAKLQPVDGRSAWAEQFGVEIKLGDRVVFSRATPEKGSPYGTATTDVQTNLRIKEILQHALDFVNASLGVDSRNFKS